MATGITYPHLEFPDGGAARLARLPRIRVAQIVMGYLAHGWSVDEMCRQYPHLQPAEVHAAMTYYFDHQQQMDEEVRADLEEAAPPKNDAERSPFYVRMRAQGRL